MLYPWQEFPRFEPKRFRLMHNSKRTFRTLKIMLATWNPRGSASRRFRDD